MSPITFSRILNNGFLNYKRNFLLSAAATAMMVVTLFIISSLLVLNVLTNLSLASVKDKVDVSIYFNLGASEQTIRQIQRQVELIPAVKSIAYIPPVTAREKFKELHKDEPLLIESVEQFNDSENPFPASFAIRVNELGDYATVISLFQGEKFEPFVKKITDKRDIVDRLNRITKGIKNIGLGLTLIFSLITILVMFNTIRLTIYNRREEIEIMRLVGASNSYIKGPFIVEGIFYALAGAVITAALLYPMIFILTPKISGFLQLPADQINTWGLNFWVLLALQIISGVILAVISSLIVVKKYLKI
ncbi:MAG: permease-like cell division protein FtsX [Candidatus Doudnabacteria bacterium]|nr:permease-like cell division protein FtsX [Candidatus Doudnabacteria bacterium]